MLSKLDVVTLITRPRRFGKTLTLSMLESFLSIDYRDLENPTLKAKSLFKDLLISRNKALCDQYMGKYPVLSLSFKDVDGMDFKSAGSFLKELFIRLYTKFSFLLAGYKNRHYLKYQGKEVTDETKSIYEQMRSKIKKDFELFTHENTPLESFKFALSRLIEFLSLYFNSPIVLLIDEYDVPLNKALTRGYYNEMHDFMKPVMGVIKNNAYIFKVVITGCLRLAQESFFTGTNNFRHYSIDHQIYAKDFGFTKEETKELLEYYNLGSTLEEVIKLYDGFRFGNSEMVCPWDVINFCSDRPHNPSMTNSYWINSSDNAILKTLLDQLTESSAEKIQALINHENIEISIDDHLVLSQIINSRIVGDQIIIEGSAQYSHEALWTILYHAGYLTRVDEPKKNDDLAKGMLSRNLLVKIPNLEIYSAYEKLIRDRFSLKNSIFSANASHILELFCEEPMEDVLAKINYELNNLLSNFISIRDGSDQGFKNYPEWYYHSFLNGLFAGILSYAANKIYQYDSNKEQGNGFADLAMVLPYEQALNKNIGIIIELKVASDDDQDLFDQADLALKQIQSKKYIQGLFAKKHLLYLNEVHAYGISFYKKECLVKGMLLTREAFS